MAVDAVVAVGKAQKSSPCDTHSMENWKTFWKLIDQKFSKNVQTQQHFHPFTLHLISRKIHVESCGVSKNKKWNHRASQRKNHTEKTISSLEIFHFSPFKFEYCSPACVSWIEQKCIKYWTAHKRAAQQFVVVVAVVKLHLQFSCCIPEQSVLCWCRFVEECAISCGCQLRSPWGIHNCS